MTTSSGQPFKLVFFKKKECGPCLQAAENLGAVLDANPDLSRYVSVLQKEDHPALVAAFELEMYPTVLILDKESNEVGRKVGVRPLTSDWWEVALSFIHKNHKL